MSKKCIPKTKCSDCDALVLHTGQPRRVKGVVMYPHFRYCTGFSRPRCFRSNDPKIYVPKWCPKRLQPAVLRIYTFKSDLAFRLYKDVGYIPECFYIVRYASSINQSANDILTKGEPEGQYLMDGEVIELDDGIRPIFFIMKNSKLHITSFDKKNISEGSHQ